LRGEAVTRAGTPRQSPSASCAVCRSLGRERRLLEVGLALGYSPRKLSRKFKALSRTQIAKHRDKCLGGDPLVAVARMRGWIDEDGNVIEEGEGGVYPECRDVAQSSRMGCHASVS
jgi:hypothetical protein